MADEKRWMPRIYMPDIQPEDIEKFKSDKPFLLRVELPLCAQFVSVCAVPSIIDLIGMSGGGGPPAFAYLVDPDEKETSPRILMTSMPEEPFIRPSPGMDVLCQPRGVIQSMGMLLMAFEFSGPDLDALEEGFKEFGCNIIDLKPYVVPPMLKQMALTKVIQAQKAHEATQGKPAG